MRKLLSAIAVLVTLASVTVLLLNRQAATNLAVNALQIQCEELRSQLEGRDQTITELQTSIERWQQSAPSANRSDFPLRPSSTESELARRIAELTILQSNTLALVERLTVRAPDSESPTERALRKQASVAFLESSLVEHQQRLEAIKQRASDLLFSLGVPPEVATLDAGKALDNASLRPYWPFFEAKRERDNYQFLTERWQIRLMQEQVEAAGDRQRATGQ